VCALALRRSDLIGSCRSCAEHAHARVMPRIDDDAREGLPMPAHFDAESALFSATLSERFIFRSCSARERRARSIKPTIEPAVRGSR
jgi:hypothetical protein